MRVNSSTRISTMAFPVVLLCTILALSAGRRLGSSESNNNHSHHPRPGRYLASHPSAKSIDKEYIVVLNDDYEDSDRSVCKQDLLKDCPGATITDEFFDVMRGFAVKIDDKDCLFKWIDDHPGVISFVEDNIEVHAEQGEIWGLDRIDQRNLPLDGQRYGIDDNDADGTGVNMFIVDTGVRISHDEFAGRIEAGFDSTGEGAGADGNGHGTHVAGTAGGTRYGVAKNVNIIPVRVLGSSGSGSTNGITRGLDYVVREHRERNKPSVANMSLGGGFSAASNRAVENTVRAGVVVVVAAGNENQNACNVSPASEPTAITVGATEIDDDRSSFSNWGTCVDLFAPGTGITSAWIGSDSNARTISGTSMASPHVAGAAALLLQSDPTLSPAEVATALVNMATTDVVDNPLGSPNKLLFVDGISPGNPPTNPAPTSSDLIITGVMDGPDGLSSGGFKVMEFYAVRDIPALESYSVGLARDGGTPSGTVAMPSRFLPQGSFVWVTTREEEFQNFFGFPADLVVSCSTLCLDGDDAVLLYRNGQVVNVFGEYSGQFSGNNWDYENGWAYLEDGTPIPEEGNNFDVSNWVFSGTNIWNDVATTNGAEAVPFPVESYVNPFATLKNVGTGMCMDLAGGYTGNGSRVVVWPCNGGHNQLWDFDRDGRIRTIRDPTKCLEGGKNSNLYAKLFIWDCHDGLHQKWTRYSSGRIKNKGTGLYAGVAFCGGQDSPLEFRHYEDGLCGETQKWV